MPLLPLAHLVSTTGPHTVVLSPMWYLASSQVIALEGSSFSDAEGVQLMTAKTATRIVVATNISLCIAASYSFFLPKTKGHRPPPYPLAVPVPLVHPLASQNNTILHYLKVYVTSWNLIVVLSWGSVNTPKNSDEPLSVRNVVRTSKRTIIAASDQSHKTLNCADTINAFVGTSASLPVSSSSKRIARA